MTAISITKRARIFAIIVGLLAGFLILPQQAAEAHDLTDAELPFVGTHKISGNWYGENTHNLQSSSSWDADYYALDWNMNEDVVFAIKSGTVNRVCSTCTTGYGKYVLISHAGGYYSLYAHLSRVDVKAGDPVTIATVLGISGSSGNVTGPHLHLHVMKKSGSTYYAHKPAPMSCYTSFPHDHNKNYTWPC